MITGEEVSIVVKDCPLVCSQILTWRKENIFPGRRWTQVYWGLSKFWLHFMKSFYTRPPRKDRRRSFCCTDSTMAAKPANPLVSVMPCGISHEHSSGIFSNTIFMSEPGRKSLTCKFTSRIHFLFPKEDYFFDKHSKNELLYQWHVFVTCSCFIIDVKS